MPLPDEKTIQFDIWPNMLMIEGTELAVGQLIAALYDDPAIPRESWNVGHTHPSRKTYAEVLIRDAGAEKKRQGMGVRTDEVLLAVEDRARSLGLACFRLSKKTQGAI
jgi:hypothetical protein